MTILSPIQSNDYLNKQIVHIISNATFLGLQSPGIDKMAELDKMLKKKITTNVYM